MQAKDDIKFMRRCLEMASKAEGLTYPNPMVGSVIVNNGRIIGEGYHLKAGEPHAEVNAIKSVIDKSELKFSTLYVNLEPCSHFGKTPPCADFIIENSIPRVVIGTIDTSKNVSGNGVSKLKDAGIKVVTGVAEDECRELNKRFFTFHEKKRPYIILKWAQSADGYIDIIRKRGHKAGPTWISGKPERTLVHKWRATEEAILVGAVTVKADNPKLNVREWKGPDPLRMVLSNSGLIDSNSEVLKGNGKVVVFTGNIRAEIENSILVELNDNAPASYQIADYLYKKGIQSLLIEGGAKVLGHFIATGMWDEARIFKGDSDFSNGVKAPQMEGELLFNQIFSGSTMEYYLNS